MQGYRVVFADIADSDLEDIVMYLSGFSPDIALRYYAEIVKKANSLSAMPERYPFVNDEVLRAAGYRWLAVRNYIIFYFVNKVSHKVQIRRILYSGRDYTVLL